MQRLNPTTVMLIAGAALLLLFGFLFLRGGNADQDKLSDNATETAAADDPEKRCASKATYDLIKRELFRRAAQVRGSDQAAFARLADYASVRMDRPVLESENEDRGEVSCSGALSVDLPPGVAVVGGRRTLGADVDYQLQRSADRSGDVLTLGNADAIITPLATLARTGQPLPQPTAGYDSSDQALPGPESATAPVAGTPPPIDSSPPPPPRPAPPQQPPPESPETSSARPSFNCANARTRGEIAVCRDSGLASLDQQMAGQFNRAMSGASAGERQMLIRTRNRFLAYRDRCRSDACIADAYRGRMAEIRDITAGGY